MSLSIYRLPYNVIPVSMDKKFSTIEHLVLNHDCDLNELIYILSHTPHLRHLTCQYLTGFYDFDTNKLLLTLPNLTYVSFVRCEVDFDTLENFMKKISSQLQTWHLNTSEDMTYLDTNRWKRLIEMNMPHLCKFHFNYHVFNNYHDIVLNCEAINQFTSIFWTERQWFFELKCEINKLVYSIHPYR
ncbi:unnamed protein product [Rotaria sp. Silwood1]|nr:unnamed protein product [Rotaria sp. Silwood1]CAF1315400.1 unnamed protein product [Rotaria sp. Silwood1]CAF3476195.1 unnamed protein product [Rotaria sp. Silwood1]CAF3488504.1 unnamed protein product [Rotaria sp. Silwood1]CAF4728961.1 unnamed protein product [Rotaria sp. Silwood1]